MKRYDLEVPYERKDEAKALGAYWDPALKCWGCDQVDLQALEEFEPRLSATPWRTHFWIKQELMEQGCKGRWMDIYYTSETLHCSFLN